MSPKRYLETGGVDSISTTNLVSLISSSFLFKNHCTVESPMTMATIRVICHDFILSLKYRPVFCGVVMVHLWLNNLCRMWDVEWDVKIFISYSSQQKLTGFAVRSAVLL